MAIVFLTVATALLSCNRKTVYNQYAHTPKAGWNRGDTLCFCVDTIRQDGLYTGEVGIRISGHYPFTTLSLIVEQQIMPAGIYLADTVSCRLFDNKGNMKGKGVSLYQYAVKLPHSVSLRQGNSLKVKVRHYMKRETLPGIANIGIKLRKE